MTESPRVLILPGWQGSGPLHWQSRWEREHGFCRVEQDDWLWPKRGDWMARLEDVLLESPQPTVLVAHSLGCQLVAAWAAHSQHTARVRAALLVAPADVERDDMPPNLCVWRPIVRRRLPFTALAVVSDNDPFCSSAAAQRLAQDWGCGLYPIGPAGHINAGSGLGDWPEGLALLHGLTEGCR
jgi:predicted alpha/beta hydrolase family esterase